RYRFVAFLVSGVFTGLAGALWVPLNGLTTPDIIHWSFSGEIVFMTVLGGFRSFAGPIVGAVVFNYLKTYAVGYTVYWQLLLAADSGQLLFRGQDVTHESVHGRISAGIARSFQLVNLFDQLSALDNVALTIFSREGKTRKLVSLESADHAVWDEALEILRLFGLEGKAQMLAGGVSQGERKRSEERRVGKGGRR